MLFILFKSLLSRTQNSLLYSSTSTTQALYTILFSFRWQIGALENSSLQYTQSFGCTNNLLSPVHLFMGPSTFCYQGAQIRGLIHTFHCITIFQRQGQSIVICLSTPNHHDLGLCWCGSGRICWYPPTDQALQASSKLLTLPPVEQNHMFWEDSQRWDTCLIVGQRPPLRAP